MNTENSPAKVGDRQLEMLHCFWNAENGELSGPEMIDQMKNRYGIVLTKSAVNAMLQLLIRKGYVKLLERRGHSYCYRVEITEEEFQRQEVDRMRKNLFHGSAAAMLVSLMGGDMSEEEIEKARAVLRGE